MIQNLGCVEFYLIMTVVIVLVLIPVVAWIIRRQVAKSKKSTSSTQQATVPPLMYITTVSTHSTDRLADIDIPVSTTSPLLNVLQLCDSRQRWMYSDLNTLTDSGRTCVMPEIFHNFGGDIRAKAICHMQICVIIKLQKCGLRFWILG